MSGGRSFAQNMQDMSKLNCVLEPHAQNYHQTKEIAQLQESTRSSQQALQDLLSASRAKTKDDGRYIEQLQKEKQQLQELNLELVGYSQKLAKQLEHSSQKLEQVAKQLQQERARRSDAEARHAREIDNMKLIHSQELYILKKKEKKPAV